jgi:hypothetical protein
VTTILNRVLAKPGLVQWANRLGLEGKRVDDEVNSAADVGTAVHELARAEIAGRKPVLPPLSPDQLQQATNSFSKFLDWRKARRVQVIATERSLVSESMCYGGTVDAVVQDFDDEELTIWDFKTGRAIYDEHLFQVAGYAHLCRENGMPVSSAWVIRFGKTEDEGFEAVRFDLPKLELGWRVFQHCAHIYRLLQELDYMSRGGGRRRAQVDAAL